MAERPRAADDFAAIAGRLKELRETTEQAVKGAAESGCTCVLDAVGSVTSRDEACPMHGNAAYAGIGLF